jgi:transcriptional regulator with XRE-family HTH domain
MSCRRRKTNDRRGQRDPESLSERIYQWRAAHNLSQSEAAMKLKLSKRTLQEWEQGRATPTHLGLIALEAALGRPINRMAGRRRRKQKPPRRR